MRTFLDNLQKEGRYSDKISIHHFKFKKNKLLSMKNQYLYLPQKLITLFLTIQ